MDVSNSLVSSIKSPTPPTHGIRSPALCSNIGWVSRRHCRCRWTKSHFPSLLSFHVWFVLTPIRLFQIRLNFTVTAIKKTMKGEIN